MLSFNAGSVATSPVFWGTDGHECEQFIQDIQKRALYYRMTHDGKWMASYASTCFEGGALRWFEALETDMRTPWSKLRKALLKRYPPAKALPSSSNVRSSIIPTAASARTPDQNTANSPAAAQLLYSPWLSNPVAAIQRGIVQITTVRDGGTLYLSRELGNGPTTSGFVRALPTKSDALQVRVQGTSSVQRIATDSSEVSYLACHSYDVNVDLSSQASVPYYGMLTLVDISESGSLSSPIKLKGVKPHRRFQIDMWQLESSGDISAYVVDDVTGQAHRVLPYVDARLSRTESSTWVVFLKNISWWDARNPGKLQLAKLVFVPSE